MQTPARARFSPPKSTDPPESEPPPTDWFIPYVEKPVSLLAYRLAGRTNLYEDLRQEGLHAACQAVHSFHPDAGASLETYALRCARNRMLDYLKREQRITRHTISGDEPVNENNESLLDTLAYQPRSFETPDTALLLGRLQSALMALPLRESAFIRLSFYGEVSQAEIAAQFFVTRARVGQVIAHAIHRLQKNMGYRQRGPHDFQN